MHNKYTLQKLYFLVNFTYLDSMFQMDLTEIYALRKRLLKRHLLTASLENKLRRNSLATDHVLLSVCITFK